MKRGPLVIAALALVAAGGLVTVARKQVGNASAAGVVVTTGQTVRDSSLKIAARPVDLLLDPSRARLYVKENRGLSVIDTSAGKLITEVAIPGGASLTGLAQNGDRLAFSDAGKAVHFLDVTAARPNIVRKIEFPTPKVGGNPYPCGLIALDGGNYAVALSRSNAVAIFDEQKILHTIPVEVAPFSLGRHGNSLWVTCWGRTPATSEPSATSSGTPVAVDSRGIATGGSLVEIDLTTQRVVRTIPVGSQPSGIQVDDASIWITEAASDRLVKLDAKTGKEQEAIQLEVGTAPTAITRLSEGRLAVACGGANRITVFSGEGERLFHLSTGWYPVALVPQGEELWVANAKGIGSRGLAPVGDGDIPRENAQDDPKAGRNVYQFTGTIDRLPADAVRTAERPPKPLVKRDNQPARPVPERTGEPSPIKHVFYILKENRTYDQVFGDLKQGDGDPDLCLYPRKITPNHHALAEEFVLLDNYYCNGVLSADGHSWSTEANATSYFERSFGGWTRSYPYGDDPLAISTSGHIWDRVLDANLTFRNYGEYNYSSPAGGEMHNQILADWQSGARKIQLKHNIAIARLRKHSNPDSPGWNMNIPDQVRADIFIRDFQARDRSGTVPNFSFIYLPQDHGSGKSPGMPTPNSHVADNDLALGKVVEAISKSKVWKSSVIFAIEDDPQDGFDHVDGHRSLCLVVSPYSRRGQVVSEFYNQAAVLKTVGLILGTPPLGKFDQMANSLAECFADAPNLKAYRARPNQVPLDELNPKAKTTAQLDLSGPDRVPEDLFNRQLWEFSRPGRAYPAKLAGAHGAGLKARGLRLEGGIKQDDDD